MEILKKLQRLILVNKNFRHHHSPKCHDVDIVFMWVDDKDINWQREKEKWQRLLDVKGVAVNVSRYRNNDELRYALRSVHKNIPWVRKIYLITNGQKPSWLDLSHPKISLVKHSDILPKEALPCFNSTAIEAGIHKIKDLSEFFLLANDDTFICRAVEKSNFFKGDKPILRTVPTQWTPQLTTSNIYCNNVTFANKLIEKKYGKKFEIESHHNIDAYRKSVMMDAFNLFPEDFNRTIRSKFRQKGELHRSIVNFYMLANELCEQRMVGESIANMRGSLVMEPTNLHTMLKKISSKKYLFLCLNDNEFVQRKHVKNISIFLNALFPIPAPWEKMRPKISFLEKIFILVTRIELLILFNSKKWQKE